MITKAYSTGWTKEMKAMDNKKIGSRSEAGLARRETLLRGQRHR